MYLKQRSNFRFVSVAMVESVLYCLGFLVPATMTISIWAVTPFVSGEEITLPIKAWYPFDTKPTSIYIPMFIFQIYGIAQSAAFNISTDTIAAALFGHAKAQIERLGLMLSKVKGFCNFLKIDNFSRNFLQIGYENNLSFYDFQNDNFKIVNHKEGTIVRTYLDKKYSIVVEVSVIEALKFRNSN